MRVEKITSKLKRLPKQAKAIRINKSDDITKKTLENITWELSARCGKKMTQDDSLLYILNDFFGSMENIDQYNMRFDNKRGFGLP